MKRGFMIHTESRQSIDISSRKRRIVAVRAIIAHLDRIRNTELRSMNNAPPHWRCESELISEVIDEAINILESLY